jgi:beta-lactam-binding protein with PASTA domain
MPSVKSIARNIATRLLGLVRNRYFWMGIAAMAVIGLIAYAVVDDLIMPRVTRHGVAVIVPDVMSLPFDEAANELDAVSLLSERITVRRPNVPRDVVIDQRPPGGTAVKPGRRVYVTINSGDTSTVAIPKVIGLSLREAQSRMVVLGLVVPQVRPDSIPSSHANTVTRQRPAAGSRAPHGTEVTLWYSTGLGETYMSVPDVVGLSADTAREQLLRMRLRSVVLGLDEVTGEPIVLDQSPAPGTQVREGFEVRLRVAPGTSDQTGDDTGR